MGIYGGTVQAESEGEGQGATLTVWLPLPAAASSKALSLPEESTPESDLEPFSNTKQDTALLTGLRILAVDNEIDTLELLRFMLENYGAEVLTATSASEALAALTTNPNQYNLLLSDIGMPCEDGYFLIQHVRELDAKIGGQIPAIALTAYASEQDQLEAMF